MSLFASCLRVAFCISRVKGVGHDNSIFGDTADSVLIPLPEIIWMGALLFLVLVSVFVGTLLLSKLQGLTTRSNILLRPILRLF